MNREQGECTLEAVDHQAHCFAQVTDFAVNITEQNSCHSGVGLGLELVTLGQKFDLPLSGMSKEINPSREWKQQKYKLEWLIGDTINASIGQGYTAATPMQLATMVARVASGRAVTPRFVRPADGTDSPASPLGVDAANLAMVHQGMFEVSNSERGTAYASRIADVTKAMAGKTGTSQVFSITAAERAAGVRSQDELPWNRRDHGLFVAFAPFDAPRYAVTVVVEHGGGGSTAAAPIARKATGAKTPPKKMAPSSHGHSPA